LIQKKTFVAVLLLGQKSEINFCGTTQIGAKHPLALRTIIRIPLITGGIPVGHYSVFVKKTFPPTFMSPFHTALLTAIPPPAALLEAHLSMYSSQSTV